jgi:hypothetical protein
VLTSILGAAKNPAMLPAFDNNGRLPPGIHPAPLAEVEARFGRGSELRRIQFESVRWMIDLAKRAGVHRIILNGSFVTDIIEPNDVDCALLVGPGVPVEPEAVAELEAGLPFLQVQLVRQDLFDDYVNVIFATDRWGSAKGMVEVIP